MRTTKEHLEQRVSYDPSTGDIRWLVSTGRRSRVGSIVGSSHSNGYIEMCVDGHRLFAHQAAWVIMTGEWPTFQIDHINGNRKDNRWENLRAAVQKQNSANMRKRSNNKSGYKGVAKIRDGAWGAYIHVNGKTKYLGTYSCPRVAHGAYVMAAAFTWGEYARSA